GILDWKRQMNHSTSRLGNSKDKLSSNVGPTTYAINREPTEHHLPMYSVPKDPCANFLDKAVKDTYSDHRAKKEKPGPDLRTTTRTAPSSPRRCREAPS
ncbi:unnamed protein product, partial [Prorocentrum cordatum]